MREEVRRLAGVRRAGGEIVPRANGDVWLGDVPMVDQGQKGYCVVASTERVMRYYGSDVDANELAQVANSSASGGTSLGSMRDAMKKLTARLKIRTRELEKTDMKEGQIISDALMRGETGKTSWIR